jgi:AcrR family transcriptional regulator
MPSFATLAPLPNEDPKRQAVLAGALHVFTRYGYQRTSMADLAAAAKLSRPALYLLYKNKADVFCSLAHMLFAQALNAAYQAWPEEKDPIDGLTSAILAKDLPFFRLLKTSPHGAEIIATGENLSAALVREFEKDFAAFLSERLHCLGPAHIIERLARMLTGACHGLKHTAIDEADFVHNVALLVKLLIAGLRNKAWE